MQKCLNTTTLLAINLLLLDVDGRLSTISDGHFGIQQYWPFTIVVYVSYWLWSSNDNNRNIGDSYPNK